MKNVISSIICVSLLSAMAGCGFFKKSDSEIPLGPNGGVDGEPTPQSGQLLDTKNFELLEDLRVLNSRHLFKWTEVENAKEYSIAIARDADCKDTLLSTLTSETYHRFDRLEAGDHYVCLSVNNGEAFVSAKNSGLSVEIKKGWYPISPTTPFPEVGNIKAYWTGTEIIVMGNLAAFDARGSFAYNPANNTWREITDIINNDQSINYGGSVIVWNGTEAIVLVRSTSRIRFYNPSTDTWREVMSTNAPPNELRAGGVWTGSHLIVFGGVNNGQSMAYGTGAKYDPTTNNWTPISNINGPGISDWGNATWDEENKRMVIWGSLRLVNGMQQIVNTGKAYYPEDDTWLDLVQNSAPAPRWQHSLSAIGDLLFVFGGLFDLSIVSDTATGAVYDPISQTWFDMGPMPISKRRGSAVAPLGDSVFLYGGQYFENDVPNRTDAYFFYP